MVSIFSSEGDYLRSLSADYLNLAAREPAPRIGQPEYPPFDHAAHEAKLAQERDRFIRHGNTYVGDVVEHVSKAGAEFLSVTVKDGEDGVPFLRAHLRFANGFAVEVGYNEVTRAMYNVNQVTYYIYVVRDGVGHALSDDYGYYEENGPALHGCVIEDTRHARFLAVSALPYALASVKNAPDYTPSIDDEQSRESS
jgi:hypothetical protein